MRALLLVLLILGGQARAADPVLAPGGTLRAAYIVANLAQARLDPTTGTVTGVIADITREMGRRAGVPVAISPLPTASAVLQAVRSGEAEIGFVAPNPERTGVVLYSQTYMLVQQSALVRADSGGRQRIAAATRDVPGLRLLDDNFYGVPQAIAVPTDREDRLALVNTALDEFRASGFLADAVARSGIDGLAVAPAR